MSTKTVNVSTIFDTGRFSLLQHLTIGFCVLITLLDGFDLTIIGLAIPKIRESLDISTAALGIAVGVSQIGPVVGALLLGALGDRLGRKWMLVVCAFVFGVFTLLIGTINDVEQLAIYRFISGVGLGGAIPNALALGSEYAPRRIRSTIVSTMYAGVPGGATIGGLCGAFLIPAFGWQSLFFVGGSITILVTFIVAALLPESLEFLIQRGKDERRIRKIVARISPEYAVENIQFRSQYTKAKGAPVANLFTEGRAFVTILVWAICGIAMYLVWILNAWAPTLLKEAGASVMQYSFGYAGLMFGAALASVAIGLLMDKKNPFLVLQIGFVLAAISLIGFGLVAGTTFALMLLMCIVCGMCINGSQTGTMALATNSYSPALRTTGVGAAYAVGKAGAILAPVIGGFMLDAGFTVFWVCAVNAVVGLVVVACATILKRSSAAKRVTSEIHKARADKARSAT
ncbi:MAG: MFS transporter [Thermoleophilia bacterium]|jgi:AAHS family 4-hydroxybenzoate transporter-like MFS transporter